MANSDEEIEEFLNSLPPELLKAIHRGEFEFGHDAEESMAAMAGAIGQCILGVLESLIPLLVKAFGAAAIQCAIGSFGKFNDRPNVVHLLNAIVGFCLFFAHSLPNLPSTLPLLLYFASSCALINFLPNDLPQKGPICILFTIFFIIACQLGMEPADFLAIRGPWMIAAMKQISLCIDFGSANSPPSSISLISQFGYIFDSCTLLFGPFITFEQFQKMPSKMRERAMGPKALLLIQFLHFCRHLLLAFLFLLFSTCLFDPNNSPAFHQIRSIPRIFRHFFTAFAFRSSHYFICHFSSALAILGGHSPGQAEIVQWKAIEWPRSMGQVATHWNVPMHTFLHKYIYLPNKSAQIGPFQCVLLTFAVSAALHGLDLQMAAVLLSLGLFAVVEKILRHKLASLLSICIRVKDCPAGRSAGRCGHRCKKNHPASILLRLLFIANNIFWLIYLGAPFHGDGQFHGYSLGHLWHIWAGEFLLSGHLIGLAMLAAAFAIPSAPPSMQREKAE